LWIQRGRDYEQKGPSDALVLQHVLAVSTGEVVEVSDRQRDRSQI
jgi:hypothetical protein